MNRATKMFLVAALAAVTFAGVSFFDGRYHDSRIAEAKTRFQLLGTLRKSALENYLNTARAEVSFWSVSERIRESATALENGWRELGEDAETTVRDLYYTTGTDSRIPSAISDAGDGSRYSRAHAEFHSLAREFVTGRGYYDFFLIDLDGNIVYSVEKESDFGTNLADGVYRETELASVFRQITRDGANDDVVLSDLGNYPPSGNAPAMFVGKLMRNANGESLGVLALQLPVEALADIMQFTSGMGDSGETYLVGGDFLMRSDSRFSETSTILKTAVETETVKRALAGQRGVDFSDDYRGVPVLSAYDYLDFNGIRWAVMAEIDEAEVELTLGNIRLSLAAAGFALFTLVLSTVWALSGGIFGGEDPFGGDSDVDLDLDAG